jgi:hypothetical protein
VRFTPWTISPICIIKGAPSLELFFRHIKTTMGMEQLRCKTPPMVRKELQMFIVAYNLIRALDARSRCAGSSI